MSSTFGILLIICSFRSVATGKFGLTLTIYCITTFLQLADLTSGNLSVITFRVIQSLNNTYQIPKRYLTVIAIS